MPGPSSTAAEHSSGCAHRVPAVHVWWCESVDGSIPCICGLVDAQRIAHRYSTVIVRSLSSRFARSLTHLLRSSSRVCSTGASVDLPAPLYTPLEAEVDGDESDGDDGDEEGGDGGEEDEKQPKKKAKTAAADKGPGKGQRSHEGPKPIRVLAFHENKEWMMYQAEDKYIHLYHIDASYASGFKHIVTVAIPKKVQSAVFHSASSPSSVHIHPSSGSPLALPHLLVADKTGDIFAVTGSDLADQKMELGHLANVTDLSFFTQPAAAAGSKSKSYCLSSDSDGKIRVSNVPNYFDIQAFCLGHHAFVSAFTVVPSAQPTIVSGGLGSEVILWSLADGAPLGRVDLAAHKPAAASSSSSAPAAAASKEDCYVSQVSYVSSHAGAHTVLVSVYPWSCVFLLALDASNHLAVSSVVQLPSTPMHALGSADQLLFVDDALKVRAFTLAGAEVADDALLVSSLERLNSPLAPAQSAAATLAITPQNAEAFVGGGTEQGKYAPTTEEGKAKQAASLAAGHTGRYISPFSSLHADHLLRLSLLSASGFTFRRYADKMQREAYIQSKKVEANAKREAQKAAKQQKKQENQRKRKEDEMQE
jgi:WD40 repeat protein